MHIYLNILLQGERLSHAVGCAFAVCLEQKQKRDRDSATTASALSSSSSAAATSAEVSNAPPRSSSLNGDEGLKNNSSTPIAVDSIRSSFRRVSLAERKQDPQNVFRTGTKYIYSKNQGLLSSENFYLICIYYGAWKFLYRC